MKKSLILMVLLICAIVANAATYRVKFDIINQRAASFIVKIDYNRLTIGSTAYPLRRMGTITNSGFTFDSYAYGSSSNGALCVSTASTSIQKDRWSVLSGYIIIIDDKAYLADKIN